MDLLSFSCRSFLAAAPSSGLSFSADSLCFILALIQWRLTNPQFSSQIHSPPPRNPRSRHGRTPIRHGRAPVSEPPSVTRNVVQPGSLGLLTMDHPSAPADLAATHQSGPGGLIDVIIPPPASRGTVVCYLNCCSLPICLPCALFIGVDIRLSDGLMVFLPGPCQ